MTTQKNAKHTLLSAKQSVSRVATEIQKMAQDMDSNGGGTLGPDQVKEILSGVSENLNQVISTIQDVAENVPASEGQTDDEGMDDESEDDSTMTAGEIDLTKKEMGLQSKYEKTSKNKTATEDLAKLREEVAKLKEAAELKAKEEIATQIASKYPLSQRQAKFDEIMKSKDSIDILKAKLAGMNEISTSTKLASSRKDLNGINPIKATIFNEGGSAQRQASMGMTHFADLTDI